MWSEVHHEVTASFWGSTLGLASLRGLGTRSHGRDGPREKSPEEQCHSIVFSLGGVGALGVGRAGGCSGMHLRCRVCGARAGSGGLGIPWEAAGAGARPALQTLITTRCPRHCLPCSAPPPTAGHSVPGGDTSGDSEGSGSVALGRGVRGWRCPDPAGVSRS